MLPTSMDALIGSLWVTSVPPVRDAKAESRRLLNELKNDVRPAVEIASEMAEHVDRIDTHTPYLLRGRLHAEYALAQADLKAALETSGLRAIKYASKSSDRLEKVSLRYRDADGCFDSLVTMACVERERALAAITHSALRTGFTGSDPFDMALEYLDEEYMMPERARDAIERGSNLANSAEAPYLISGFSRLSEYL